MTTVLAQVVDILGVSESTEGDEQSSESRVWETAVRMTASQGGAARVLNALFANSAIRETPITSLTALGTLTDALHSM
jgi:hypothetical protein